MAEAWRVGADNVAARQWTVEQARAQQKEPERASARPVKTMAWLLLAVSVLTLPLSFVVGIVVLTLPLLLGGVIGIVAAIGLMSRQNWGRYIGLALSLLLETVGLLFAFVIVIILTADPVPAGDAIFYMVASSAAMVSLSVGIILAFLLSRESVVFGLGADLKRPAGVLPIAVPMMLTVVGAKPALDLLRNRNRGRTHTIVVLAIFALFSMVGAVVAGFEMRETHYSYYAGGGYSTSSNEMGFAIAVIEAAIVGIWCLIGIFYLASSRVKSRFQR
jgi:hypothetical protein